MRITFGMPDGEEIVAEYHGGAYVDLYFGGHPVPSDVINVWDYRKGESTVTDCGELIDAVSEWVAQISADDPDWYNNYLANLP